MGDAPVKIPCPRCKGSALRVYHMPRVSFGKWNPRLSFNDVSCELDGEREAIAVGMEE